MCCIKQYAMVIALGLSIGKYINTYDLDFCIISIGLAIILALELIEERWNNERNSGS